MFSLRRLCMQQYYYEEQWLGASLFLKTSWFIIANEQQKQVHRQSRTPHFVTSFQSPGSFYYRQDCIIIVCDVMKLRRTLINTIHDEIERKYNSMPEQQRLQRAEMVIDNIENHCERKNSKRFHAIDNNTYFNTCKD